LHLAPGAGSAEVEIAYETLRESALAAHPDRDTALFERLELLERAYHAALPSGGAAYRRS
jgi:hypothetical protein